MDMSTEINKVASFDKGTCQLKKFIRPYVNSHKDEGLCTTATSYRQP